MIKDGLLADEVRSVQALIAEFGGSYFSEAELEDFRCLVRLTVEFAHHLEDQDRSPLSPAELRYLGESIFSGVDSFCVISSALRATAGETESTLPRDGSYVASLKQVFKLKYGELLAETSFEKRCRVLLDLFKLQIIFAGLSY